jgi:hypothetical protein
MVKRVHPKNQPVVGFGKGAVIPPSQTERPTEAGRLLWKR